MKHHALGRRHLASLALLALPACFSDSARVISADSENGDGSLPPAVMVSVFSRTPDGSNLYVGVYPEMPAGDLDRSRMLEVGGASRAEAFDGNVYVWDGEGALYRKFSVDEAGGLREEGSMSLSGLGVTGNVQTRFISATNAQTLTDDLLLVAWDPTAMEIRGTIPTEGLEDPAYPRVEYGEPELFGEFVAWPVLWSDYDNFRFKPEVGVLLSALDGGSPARTVRDARCGAGWELFVDAAGDLYVTGTGYFGFAHFFGEAASTYPNDCVLRIRAGDAAFDDEYHLDLNQATGSPAVYHTWQVSDRTLLGAVWDPADAPPTDGDAYWNAPLLRKLVFIEGTASRPFDDIPKSAVWSTVDHRLDDVLYMLSSEGLIDAAGAQGARSTLYEITESGAREVFSTAGEFWGLGRVR